MFINCKKLNKKFIKDIVKFLFEFIHLKPNKQSKSVIVYNKVVS